MSRPVVTPVATHIISHKLRTPRLNILRKEEGLQELMQEI